MDGLVGHCRRTAAPGTAQATLAACGRHVFTERADGDLVRLRAFLAHKSPRAANAAALRIVAALDLLLLFPHSGIVIRGDIRRLIIKHGRGAYIARYRIVGEDIQILRIWHSRERRR